MRPLISIVLSLILASTAVQASERSIGELMEELKIAQEAGDTARVNAVMQEIQQLGNVQKDKLKQQQDAAKNDPKVQKMQHDMQRLQEQLKAKQESLEFRIGIAARKGDLAQVKALHAQGAKINEYSLDPAPPLFEALMNGRDEVAKWLLANGAQMRVQGKLVALDALDTAVRRREDNSAMIRYLVEAGAPLDQNAATLGSSMMTELDRNGGGDGSAAANPHNIRTSQMRRGSALWAAIDLRKLKHARTLLELKADPNVFGNGFTPLMQAAGRLDVDAVKLLLEYKADPNVKGPNHITALQRAEKVKELPANKAKRDAVIGLLKAAGAGA